jgi:NAD(P)-dependent dehydrogenase (short-subunit alcohol dehydrogenase family)
VSGLDLSGRVAVVTGAARGLGRAYAIALANAGAGVVVNDLDEAAVAALVGEIDAAGGRAVAQLGSVADGQVAQALVERAVEEFGRIDVICTNAGILRDRVLWKMSDEDFDAVIATHLRGTFLCARAAAVRMREQGEGGRLILVGSPAGQRGNFGQTNYAAAKAGIAALARTWAMELARDRITVNAIVPTAFTAMVATIPIYAPLAEALERGEPLPAKVRREHALGPPEDAAPLVVFLASELSQKITGQCIGIGGDKLSIWSHPQEVALEFSDGGWSAEQIAAAWEPKLAPHEQTYGIEFPPLE